MSLVLTIKKEEARFTRDVDKGDFAIDCSCGGNGSVLRDGRGEEQITAKSSESKQHTFYVSDGGFLRMLLKLKQNNTEPLTIVCNHCSREFPITFGSYMKLIDKMIEENREYILSRDRGSFGFLNQKAN